MGIFNNIQDKQKEKAQLEIEELLISNETIDSFYSAGVVDFCAITNKRLIFFDKDGLKKAIIGIPFSKINAVSLKRDNLLSKSKEILVSAGYKEYELAFISSVDAISIFKAISDKIL